MKIKLSEFIDNPSFQVRTICTHTLATYRAALRAGDKFPPITIDQHNNIICGFHRYNAYKTVLDMSDLIECEVVTFDNEADLIRYAASDNSKHGLPLSTFDKKRLVLRLKRLGVDFDSISQTLSTPITKIQQWAGMTVCVVGMKAKKPYRRVEPLKGGLEHLRGQDVTEKQYAEHSTMDRGVPAVSTASSLIRWIENGWISDDSKTMAKMNELYIALAGLMDKQKVKKAG